MTFNIKIEKLDERLQTATSDVHYSTHGEVFKPDYNNLIEELKQLQIQPILPALYKKEVLSPFKTFVEHLTPGEFHRIFHTSSEQLSPGDKETKKIISIIGEVLIQHNHTSLYFPSSYRDLRAVQAVVTSIFEKVTTALNLQTIPPLASWSKNISPFAKPKHAFSQKKILAGIVNFPVALRNGGLFGWSSISHEIGGHHFLGSIDGLLKEIQNCVQGNLLERYGAVPFGDSIADYWSACIEEVASDVLGALNLGPSFGFGLLAHIRGTRKGKLLSSGPLFSPNKILRRNAVLLKSDSIGTLRVDSLSEHVTFHKRKGFLGYIYNNEPFEFEKYNSTHLHPLDILRPILVGKTIRLLGKRYEAIAEAIENDANNDFDPDQDEITFFQLNEEVNEVISIKIPKDFVIETAEATAELIATTKFKTLKNNSFLKLFPWTLMDEKYVEEFMRAINDPEATHLPNMGEKKSYARHILAAAILCAIEDPLEMDISQMDAIERIFHRMKDYLVETINTHPVWKSQTTF